VVFRGDEPALFAGDAVRRLCISKLANGGPKKRQQKYEGSTAVSDENGLARLVSWLVKLLTDEARLRTNRRQERGTFRPLKPTKGVGRVGVECYGQGSGTEPK
jgi:hypothetical protein